MVPEGAYVLPNDNGAAPGIILENDKGKILMLFPGPPNEMKPMFTEEVKPILAKKSDTHLFSRVLKICGIGESAVENMLRDIIDNQTNPTLALYAKTQEVELRVTAKAADENEAGTLLEPVVKKAYEVLGDHIYGENEDTLQSVVLKKLRDKNFKLATAESCTGGMIASRIVAVDGASDVFMEGFVTYSNESKTKNLGVKKETLEQYGAVSENTAKEMAEGAAKSLNCEVGIATTGIAGPGGGTEEKPVGTIFIAVFINGELYCDKLLFNGDREKIRERASTYAVNMLRTKL